MNSCGHLYFVGIVGHAMRGLALAARGLGYEVTGFDPGAEQGSATEWLADHELKWSREFDPGQLDGVTGVIVTGAFATPDAPVVMEAKTRGIPIKSYAQLFGELTKGKHVIDVAGTHGKTTTAALIATILDAAGHRPDFLIGIKPFNFEASVRLEGSDVVVAEGDEYRASNLEERSKIQYHHPDVLVLTSIEHDHPDFFPDLNSVMERFTEVVKSLPASGRLVACASEPNVAKVARHSPCPVLTYGLSGADYTAQDEIFSPRGVEFTVMRRGQSLGVVKAQLYGSHNVLNTLAAVAVADSEGLAFSEIQKGIAAFKGTSRRFNLLTNPKDKFTVIDDYAHHSTEVRAVVQAALVHFPNRRIVVIFRPHTYSRTKALLSEYHQAFAGAGLVYVTDIEGAREQDQEATVSGADITKGLGMPAKFIPNRDELMSDLQEALKPDDVVLCLSVSGYQDLAGDVAKLAQ